MSSDVLAFKVFASDFEFELEYMSISVVDIPTQILVTILLSIYPTLRYKLKGYVITHTKGKTTSTNYFYAKLVRQYKSKECAKFELECLLLIFIYFNSKFKVAYKNMDIECRYIRIHAKEKPSKISNTTFASLS